MEPSKKVEKSEGRVFAQLPIPENAIDRVNVLETIDVVVTDEVPIVFIEGESGCGATTLLAQFAEFKKGSCFHLFTRPASRFAYSPDYLRILLSEQFADHLGRSLASNDIVDEADYQSLFYAVRSTRKGAPIHFVIDGLQQIPESESAQLEAIFKSVLPVGVSGFRFIITGNQQRFQPFVDPVKTKNFEVLRLSRSEASRLLADVDISEEKKDSLIGICKGLPGRLSSVRNLVRTEQDAERLLTARLAEYPDFISLELESLSALSEAQRLVVALIAYSKYPLSRSSLRELTGVEDVDLSVIEQKCSFVFISEQSPFSGFQSETYRRYAERVLSDERSKVLGMQINHLSSNPKSSEALQFLPSYYQAVNQQRAILDLLDSDHYRGLLENTKSVAALRARAAVGAKSASELREAASIFQFSLQRAIFTSVGSARGFRAQVGALVALGRSDEALNIATQAPTLELRIRMLSEYARHLIDSAGKNPDEELKTVIQEYVRRLTSDDVPEDVDGLAENIAFFDIDSAIELLEKANKNKDKKERDGAFVNLALATSRRPDVHSAVTARMEAKISDERNRSLVAFMASYFGGITRADVEKIASSMAIERRVFFLRSVLAGPPLGDSSLEIVSYALEQIVADATYLPKVRDLADFATPLVYSKAEASEKSALIGRIEAQLGLVEKSSASVPMVDLKMKLAIGEFSYNFDGARDRILDGYIVASGMDASEAKVDCIALVLRSLRVVDSEGVIEAEDRLAELLQNELITALDELLQMTASHFELVRSALATLAIADVDSALNIASKLNTHISRDDAYEMIASTLVTASPSQKMRDSFSRSVSSMSTRWRRDSALMSIANYCARSAYKNEWLDDLSAAVEQMDGPERAAEALVMLLEMYSSSGASMPERIVARFRELEPKVSDAIARCELLYRASACAAKWSVEVAQSFYECAEVCRYDMRVSSESGVQTLKYCLALILRASRPLLENKLFEDGYLERFSRLCEALPDPVTRVAYLSDLASKAASAGRIDVAGQVISNYCRPLLDTVDPDTRLEMRRLMFPPSFRVRGFIALNGLDGIDTYLRDFAIYSLCLNLLCGLTEGDDRPDDYESCVVGFDCAENIVGLAKEIVTDNLFVGVIRAFVSCLCSKGSRQKITQQQRVAFRTDLLAMARAKLPQEGSVQHDGYLIEAEAYLSRLGDLDSSGWNDLVKRAKGIPNIADRALVGVEVARVMPPKHNSVARDLFIDCRKEINSIPSSYDRLNRLENLVEAAKTVDIFLAKASLKECMQASFELGNPEDAYRARQKLLDLAEQLDPKGLDEYVNAIDDDPARSAAKREMRQHVKVQKVRRKIASAKADYDGKDTDEDVLPSAARRNLSSLVNGRSEAIVPDHLNRYVVACGEWDIERAFPVLSWYLENIARRMMRQDDVAAKCVPLWEILLLSTELAVSVIERCDARSARAVFVGAESNAETSEVGLLIDRDDPDVGRAFIRQWLRGRSDQPDQFGVFSDPYFSPQDIDFLRLFSAEMPGVRLTVLMSRKRLASLDDGAFERAWMSSMDVDPPDVEIIGISDYEDDKAPIHDRWLMVGGECLRFGTSVSGLGSRWTEISQVDGPLREEISQLLSKYAARQKEVMGRRVSYMLVSL